MRFKGNSPTGLTSVFDVGSQLCLCVLSLRSTRQFAVCFQRINVLYTLCDGKLFSLMMNH